MPDLTVSSLNAKIFQGYDYGKCNYIRRIDVANYVIMYDSSVSRASLKNCIAHRRIY